MQYLFTLGLLSLGLMSNIKSLLSQRMTADSSGTMSERTLNVVSW
jgi:hypothetical protein